MDAASAHLGKIGSLIARLVYFGLATACAAVRWGHMAGHQHADGHEVQHSTAQHGRAPLSAYSRHVVDISAYTLSRGLRLNSK